MKIPARSRTATTILKLFGLCEILSRSKNDLVIKMILVKIEVIKIKIVYANIIKVLVNSSKIQF